MVRVASVLCLLAGLPSARGMAWRHQPKLKAQPGTCAPLSNMGTHSTVRVEVGTPAEGQPAQAFDLVADTGSNAVIVLSCACVDSGGCLEGESASCFQGTNRSSSFRVTTEDSGDMASTTLSFGSGDIQAIVASDVVSVGGSRAAMENGVLLMVDKQLDFDGPFEGILGLGIPQPATSELYETDTPLPEFLVVSKTSSFSMCFNDGADGVLRLGSEPESGKPLGSVGKLHWGLGFNGISIGEHRSLVAKICSREDMARGQETPCGAIPDSGTTAITAPEKALVPLLEGICDEWPRCRDLAPETTQPKSYVLMKLLEDCAQWMSEDVGLDELPKLTFHVTGSEGSEELLELNGWSYVLETVEDDTHFSREKLARMLSLPAGPIEATDSDRKVCVPAFQPMEMQTEQNGDVWILGTPFFYQYDVHYNLVADPPAITFSSSACGSCNGTSSLFATGRSDLARRPPRQVSGAWRNPRVDTSKPL